jgi:mycofactocin precursor
MITFQVEFGEEVNVHGVANPSGDPCARPRRSRTPPTTLGPMENEDIVEVATDDADIEEELLIEEISIDGMCGVY